MCSLPVGDGDGDVRSAFSNIVDPKQEGIYAFVTRSTFSSGHFNIHQSFSSGVLLGRKEEKRMPSDAAASLTSSEGLRVLYI